MEKNPANNAIQQDGSGKNKNKKQSEQTSSKPKVPEKIQIQPTGNQQIEILRSKLVIPKRKNPKAGGKLGLQTELEVNHLPLNFDKLFKKTVYRIDCQFTPELPKRLLRTALEQFVEKHYQGTHFAFDGGRNMYKICTKYTTKELKGITDLVTVLNEENGLSIDFTIVTSVVNQIHMDKIEEYLKNGSSNSPPGEALQALNIVLRNRPFSLRFINVSRSFFPVPRIQPVDLGEGMELWKGFFQSFVMGWKPYLNIDVAPKCFPKHQLLTSYIQNELKCPLDTELDYVSQNTLASYVKGLKIDFMVPNQPNTKRSYKVHSLLENATKFIFKTADGKPLTVLQYFKTIRNYTIKYPNLPCLHVGNIVKKTAIPIELCTVQKGQFRINKLTENQTEQMVKNAAGPPIERKQTIENCIKDINYNQDPVLKEFGIDVHEQFATVPGRVLDQPSLAYYQNRETKPNAGVWKADKLSKAVKLTKWIVLNLDTQTNITSIKKFERILMQSGKELNVMISPMDPVFKMTLKKHVLINDIGRDVQNFLNKAKKCVPPMELVVVVIPENPQGIYAAIKQASELQVGILTQCIKSKTMFKMNRATARNILLKINSKLNGINHTLSANSCPSHMEGAIIFGGDITHSFGDQTAAPSVAAVAASHDLFGSQYNMEWRLQQPKVDIIQDLEDIVHKQLLKYIDKTNTVPKKIFYYRDGVREGQYQQLLNYELIAIRRACLRLNIKYQPPITFLIVHRLHHTRIFAKNSEDMDGKLQNVPSGTIIDTEITHPTEVEFYLCSHAGIQGTSRPTKYHLIWDDNNLTDDELEQLTFYLCFMFVQCTRSVVYPAPIYYAHLAVFRARTYIENKTINLNRLAEEQVKNQLNDSFTIDTPMFFV